MTEDIRIITEPTVYLVGRQSIDDAELSRFLESVGAPDWRSDALSAGEALVEVASRNCYQSYRNPRPGGNVSHIGHILEVGHGSVLEHCVFTVLISGVSRSLTHEIVRHRVGISPSQLSQRYVDESDCAFVCPPALLPYYADYCSHESAFRDWATNHVTALGSDRPAPKPSVGALFFEQWLDHIRAARSLYGQIARVLALQSSDTDRTIARKRAREAARSVLPECTETKIALTGNARAFRNLLELRGSPHADAEIRRLALALLEVFQREAPNIFGDYRIVGGEDGIRSIHTDHRKV